MKTFLLSTVLALTACTTPKAAPERITPKPGAPSKVVQTQLAERTAVIELRFEGAGENVSVTVSGIDGLTVTSPAEAHSGLSVKAGDALPLKVSFERGVGRGHLVINVTGTFNGALQSRVHTVTIGEGPLKDDGKVQVTDDGDAVKLMP